MTTTAIVQHDYHNFVIPQRESDGYVNLTNMLAAYPTKRMSDFNNLSSTKAYLAALSVNTGYPVLELLSSKVGGTHTGTWAHPEVAIKFAAWLSPEFEVWAMRQLLKTMTEAPVAKAEQPSNPLELAISTIKALAPLAQERHRIAQATAENGVYPGLDTLINTVAKATDSPLIGSGEKYSVRDILKLYGQKSLARDQGFKAGYGARLSGAYRRMVGHAPERAELRGCFVYDEAYLPLALDTLHQYESEHTAKRQARLENFYSSYKQNA